mmetsp:Transcript_2308/g.3221  ORF Transcript_2308/g.3221 Transcript_2308/m.3221 type:complete len:233 (+) Transcript_2308:126-824(+)
MAEYDSEPEISIEEGLSAATLAALQEHLAEQACMVEEEDTLVKENFGMSQFWYDEQTAKRLAEELISKCPNEGRIAIISAPSVMHAMKEISPEQDVVLLEYDRRFDESYPGKFYYYDFNHPECISEDLHQQFDVILAAPPYLVEDVIDSFHETIRLMAKQMRNNDIEETDDSSWTKLLFVTAPKNSLYLKGKYKMGTTPLDLCFASKFATPMRCHTNYRANGLGGWLADDEI